MNRRERSPRVDEFTCLRSENRRLKKALAALGMTALAERQQLQDALRLANDQNALLLGELGRVHDRHRASYLATVDEKGVCGR
jgi:HPt (histidine-containing phosphotransfer) domain-containing protein